MELHDIHTKRKKFMDKIRNLYNKYSKSMQTMKRIHAELHPSQQPQSQKLEAISRKPEEAKSQKPEARSAKPGARSAKPKARSQSQKPEAKSQKPKDKASQKEKSQTCFLFVYLHICIHENTAGITFTSQHLYASQLCFRDFLTQVTALKRQIYQQETQLFSIMR